jgi:L-aspartate oxidase
VVDKGEAGAGSSPLAQGGLAAAVGPEDSPALHAKDTIAAGAGLCDEAVVSDLCGEGPAAVEWLVSLGCAFDRDGDGRIDLAREGGQSVARSVHWRDATGAEIVRTLRAAVRGRNVDRFTVRAVDLIGTDRCVGVMTEDDGAFIGRCVVLATGGAGGMWGITTNAPGATGDGIATALRHARVADLEFMQFHPTALAAGEGQRVLLTEALRGDGAVLVKADGERFVDELAPRHVVAKAILDHEPVWLDGRGIPRVRERFPTVAAAVAARGFDIAADLLPVSPAAHYFVGGVAADAYGRTSLPGLFAAGECASTGMHGANRLAGNSLLEAVVVGRRIGLQVGTQAAPEGPILHTSPSSARTPFDPAVRPILWRGAGPIRTSERLHEAAAALDGVPNGPDRDLALAIVRAALAREESRGVHIRADYPREDPALAHRLDASGHVLEEGAHGRT